MEAKKGRMVLRVSDSSLTRNVNDCGWPLGGKIARFVRKRSK